MPLIPKIIKTFTNALITYPRCLIQHLKKAVLYLNKHKQAIINALKYPYSNGKLEGKNNLIKVIKRVAFG
ncbi:transposase, partial [Enterococcus avium]|uniref:transposase n=1 Tax=Enterococcus avium TaxID=33945 RepID=UPI002E0DFBEA